MKNNSTRSGFKLIELVVVIAIVACLGAMILPAVLHVRAAQARTDTNNNLRALAVAVHNYHGDFHKFPPAAWTGGAYEAAPRSMWFHLLPFVGQKEAYVHNVHDAVVPAFLAPSDPSLSTGAGRVCFAANIRVFGYATLGAEKANNAVEQPSGNPSGQSLRGDLSAEMKCGLTLARIPDGTSNVFMLATRYAECGSPAQTTHYSASPIGTILADGGKPPSSGIPKGPVKGGFFGAGSHHLQADSDSPDATFQIAPNPRECLPDDSVFGHSFSAGRISTALFDASLKSVDPSFTPTRFCWGLCPSDGNVGFRSDWED